MMRGRVGKGKRPTRDGSDVLLENKTRSVCISIDVENTRPALRHTSAAFPTSGSRMRATNSVETAPVEVSPSIDETSHSAVKPWRARKFSFSSLLFSSYQAHSDDGDGEQKGETRPHAELGRVLVGRDGAG